MMSAEAHLLETTKVRSLGNQDAMPYLILYIHNTVVSDRFKMKIDELVCYLAHF